MEVAGTGIATTRCTVIVNQRFRARVWMANVPLDRLRIDQVTEKSLGKDVRKQAVEQSWHFFFRGMWRQTSLCLR